MATRLAYDQSQEQDDDNCSNGDDISDTEKGDHGEFRNPAKNKKKSKDVLLYRTQNRLIYREFPVKETHKVVLPEDENGNKMANEYVGEYKIGYGSYGKVVLYRSQIDGKH
ncbi:hypothetical protein L2E82_47596 [Cichorium intybus]|uniref:Uncharacterized protein n=1 Tax=Cichorium intybus TaxID=13427 RepID=A0ACB8YV76_CICIN|nr:hypothetical protein L2E82_47596 [Cichorium intybus]